jgi:hypothetical protein
MNLKRPPAQIRTRTKLELWLAARFAAKPGVAARTKHRSKNTVDSRIAGYPVMLRTGLWIEQTGALEFDPIDKVFRDDSPAGARRDEQRFCILATNSGRSPSPASIWVVDLMAFFREDYTPDASCRSHELLVPRATDCPIRGTVADKILWCLENLDQWRDAKAVRVQDGRQWRIVAPTMQKGSYWGDCVNPSVTGLG